MQTFLLVLSFCLGLILSGGEARIWIDATRNGQHAHLIFGTCASDSLLFRGAAERLKLKLTDPRPGLRTPPGMGSVLATELLDFADGTLTGKAQFLVTAALALARPEVASGTLSF